MKYGTIKLEKFEFVCEVNMVIDKSKVIIRPENPSEYEEVNKLIYKAFHLEC